MLPSVDTSGTVTVNTIVQRIAGWRWSRVILFLSTYVASVYLVVIGTFVYAVTTYGLLSTTDPVHLRALLIVLTLPASLVLEPLDRLRILSDTPMLVSYTLRPLLNALALVTVICVAKRSTAKAKRTPSK